jgi:aminotransferase
MRNISSKVEAIKPSGIRKFFDLVMQSEDIISLGVGEPDFTTPWDFTEHAIYQLEKGYTSYTSNYGLIELRREIAAWLERNFGAIYNPDNEILVTLGVSQGIDLVFRTLINNGDEVIIPTPNYVSYLPLVQLAGGVAVEINTASTNFILTPEQIEAAITPHTKALLLSYPNNPTGASLNEVQLRGIIDVVKKHDLWLITDEVYNQLVYEGKPLSAASYIRDNLILMNGFSKAYAMTGWRIGYVCCPKEVMDQMVKIHQYNALCASIMGQYAALEALKHGANDVEIMRKSYEQRRNLFFDGLIKIGFELSKPQGAFYLFPSVRKFGLTGEEFAMGLLQKGRVAVVPGSAFGEGLEDYIRCCYATSVDNLREALKRIEAFVKSL